MKYYVVEIQKLGTDSFAHIVHTADSRLEAESVYHQVLASAALSSLETHAAIMFDSNGFPLMYQYYNHTDENN